MILNARNVHYVESTDKRRSFHRVSFLVEKGMREVKHNDFLLTTTEYHTDPRAVTAP